MPTAVDIERGARVVAGGIDTHYHEAGAGDPVVLLHGSGPGVSAWSNWGGSVPRLAEHFRVVAIDMVGFGDTERPPDLRYGSKTWTDHVVAVLDALEIESASFVGNSLGGTVTLHLGRRFPERVRRFALMGTRLMTPGAPMTPALQAVRDYEPSVESMRDLLLRFAFDPAIVTDEIVRTRYAASAAPHAHETYRAMFHGTERRGNDYPLGDDDVRAIDVPAVLMHGRDDCVIPPDESWKLLHLLPNAELHVLPKCGHWLQIEAASRFHDIVTEFFRR